MYISCLSIREKLEGKYSGQSLGDIYTIYEPEFNNSEEISKNLLINFTELENFLMLLRPYGKSVKHTSGSKTNGRNVPGICRNNKNIDILIKGRKHIVNPITTSHQPRKFTNVALSSNQ